jgi:hypothetical protein
MKASATHFTGKLFLDYGGGVAQMYHERTLGAKRLEFHFVALLRRSVLPLGCGHDAGYINDNRLET